MANTWNLTPWDVSRRAGLAAAHTTSGRQGLTHGLNESPPQTGQPISQPTRATRARHPFLPKGWYEIYTGDAYTPPHTQSSGGSSETQRLSSIPDISLA